MDRKTTIIVMFGVLAAGLLCLIVGLIVYLAVKENVVSMLTSLFAMAMGATMVLISGIVLLVFLIIHLVKKSKNK